MGERIVDLQVRLLTQVSGLGFNIWMGQTVTVKKYARAAARPSLSERSTVELAITNGNTLKPKPH